MSTPTQSQSPWAAELNDIIRGASGGFLFSIPLLYTMEVWWIGSYANPPRMAATLLGATVIVFLLNLTGGFRKSNSIRFADTLSETIQALGFSLLFSAAILLLLRRVTFETPLQEAVGEIIYEMLPFATGMALGNQLLSGGRDEQENDQSQSGGQQKQPGSATLKDLSASAIGAAFIAFSIAPTEEIPMLAAALTPPFLLAVIATSLLISYGIVFAAGFANTGKRRREQGLFQSPLGETLAAYLVTLAVSAFMLSLYDHVNFGYPWHIWLSHTIVLGLPAAVGGAAGRLAV